MSHRHALILAINTSILAVLFVFVSWLYLNSKAEARAQAASTMDRAAAMTDYLARLRERELSALAQSIAVSPMLKGAAATRDKETIDDVLSAVAEKNDLTRVVLGKEINLMAGHFSGRAALGEGDLSLIVAAEPTAALLNSWSEITSVGYAVSASGRGAFTHNLAGADAGLLGRPFDADGVVSLGSARHYARRVRLLDGRLIADLYAPRERFWAGFESRRNWLIVLGGALFFFGLVLSVVFAELIERCALGEQARPENSDWPRLVAEIDELRKRLPT